MVSIKMFLSNKKNCVLGVFVLWCLCTLLAVLSDMHHQISMIFLTFDSIINTSTLAISFYILKKMVGVDKKIFFWFCCSYIGIIIVDVMYYFDNVFSKAPLYILNLCYIPAFFFWVAMIIFILKLLAQNIINRKFFLKILCILIIFNIPIFSLFFVSINKHTIEFSHFWVFDSFTLACKFLLFDLLMLCLICAENKNIVLFLVGMMVVTAGSTFVNYLDLSQTHTHTTRLYTRLPWMLGSLFVFLSLFFLKNNYRPDFFKNSFRHFNSITSQLALWTFGISNVGFLLFFIIAYAFSLMNTVIYRSPMNMRNYVH